MEGHTLGCHPETLKSEVRVTSEQKPSTKIIYIVSHTSVRL